MFTGYVRLSGKDWCLLQDLKSWSGFCVKYSERVGLNLCVKHFDRVYNSSVYDLSN